LQPFNQQQAAKREQYRGDGERRKQQPKNKITAAKALNLDMISMPGVKMGAAFRYQFLLNFHLARWGVRWRSRRT